VSVVGDSGRLSVKLRAVLNVLAMTGGWDGPHGVSHAAVPRSRVRGSSCLGGHREVRCSFPHARVDSGGREGGWRAGCLLLAFATPSTQAQPRPPSPGILGGRRDRATPIPDSQGWLG